MFVDPPWGYHFWNLHAFHDAFSFFVHAIATASQLLSRTTFSVLHWYCVRITHARALVFHHSRQPPSRLAGRVPCQVGNSPKNQQVVNTQFESGPVCYYRVLQKIPEPCCVVKRCTMSNIDELCARVRVIEPCACLIKNRVRNLSFSIVFFVCASLLL